jgi:26S proteasome regulatory subunit N1
MNGASIAGVLTVLHACIDMQGTIFDKYHFLLYFLVPSMNPRFLATLNEDLELSPITVRVGQAVETVGQAGRPRTITGFQVKPSTLLFPPLSLSYSPVLTDQLHPRPSGLQRPR